MLIVAAAVVLLAVFALTRIVSCATSPGASGDAELDESLSLADTESITYSFSLGDVDFASLASFSEPEAFSFATVVQSVQGEGSSEGEESSVKSVVVASEGSDAGSESYEYEAQVEVALSDEARASIKTALAPFEEDGTPVGFLLLNCSTGNGVAYNIDRDIYGASSYKAAYSTYVCQELVEKGVYSLGYPILSWQESASGFYMSGSTTIEDAIYETIVYSDNAALGSLRSAFDGDTYEAWLADLEISPDESDGGWFPTYSTREAAVLWMNTYNYLSTKTETTKWLSELLGSTETSFLRDGLEKAGYAGVTVLSKAGWCADYDEAYNATCDAGIVTYEGVDYLLCVMSGAAYSDAAEHDVEDLVAAVFAARDAVK